MPALQHHLLAALRNHNTLSSPDRARRITLDSLAVAIIDSRFFSALHPVHARASTPPAPVAPKTRAAFSVPIE
jgi:hypothetical protein